MVKSIFKNTALNDVNFWYAFATFGGLYSLGMTINMLVASDTNYAWGTIIGVISIFFYLLSLFARATSTALFGAIGVTTVLLILVISSFGAGDHIPGYTNPKLTSEETCEFILITFGYIYPAILTVFTFAINPYFFKKTKKKQ